MAYVLNVVTEMHEAQKELQKKYNDPLAIPIMCVNCKNQMQTSSWSPVAFCDTLTCLHYQVSVLINYDMNDQNTRRAVTYNQIRTRELFTRNFMKTVNDENYTL